MTLFIEDLIEAGVDVLNHVQPESMDFDEVFRQYVDRLSFCSSIGTQTAMPFKTPDTYAVKFESGWILSAKTAQGCHVEITQRDVYTVNNDIDRVKRYVKIIRESIENCW